MKVYQIWYDQNSKSKLSNQFIPFNNSVPTKPNEFEYGVMRQLYVNEDVWKNNKHLGVVSWKFEMKTQVNPHKFIQWCNNNKADVYHVNPFPFMAKQFQNVWKQGEFYHPGIIDLATDLFKRSNIDTELLTLDHPSKVCCFCNYWVANKKFWDLYMSYTESLYETIYNSEKEILDKMFHIKADQNIESGMFSFIFERMFSTVLAKHQKDFKILSYK